MTKFPPHPAALFIPRPTDEEYASLETDIVANGLHDSIELFDGKVLDGVTRQDICIANGIDPSYVTLDEYSLGPQRCPYAYVASKNTRRNLTPSQKALVAANLQSVRGGVRINPHSVRGAAKIVGVDEKLVRQAGKVIARAAPEVAELVKGGSMTVATANKLTEAVPDKEEQAKVVKAGKEEVKRRISGGVTFDVGEIEGAEAEPGRKPKNGAPLVSTKDRKEAVSLLDKLSRSLQKMGLYEQFISPLSQIRERLTQK